MGARPYTWLDDYTPDPGCLIEIGSERGEGSTAFLADYAQQHGLRFLTADIDPASHAAAAKITTGARLMSGRDLLKRLRSKVSVAYMDGFDWIPEGLEREDWIQEQRDRYRQLGYELENRNSRNEHLAEAQLIARRATERCVVICDDTWRNGDWHGKGGLAVPYLLTQGFTVAEHDGPRKDSLGYAVLIR